MRATKASSIARHGAAPKQARIRSNADMRPTRPAGGDGPHEREGALLDRALSGPVSLPASLKQAFLGSEKRKQPSRKPHCLATLQSSRISSSIILRELRSGPGQSATARKYVSDDWIDTTTCMEHEDEAVPNCWQGALAKAQSHFECDASHISGSSLSLSCC